MIGLEQGNIVKFTDKNFRAVLDELYKGNAQPFRSYFADNNITELDLSSNAYDGSFSRMTSCIVELSFDKLEMILKSLPGTPIKSVDLSNNALGFKHLSTLMRLLKSTNVTRVNLRGNISEDGSVGKIEHLISIAQAIVYSKIDSVNLGNNNITKKAAVVLLKILKQKKYKMLSLDNNPIGNGFVTKLDGLSVQDLNLANTKLSDKDAIELSRWMKTHPVTKLNVDKNSLSNDVMETLVNAVSYSKVTKLRMDDKALEAKAELMAKKRLLKAYYESSSRQIMQSTDVMPTSESMDARQKELCFSFGILLNVPQDVRNIIIDFASSHSKKFAPLQARQQADAGKIIPDNPVSKSSTPVLVKSKSFSNLEDTRRNDDKLNFESLAKRL